ncbi:MAG: GNAT family N-acetyltransferase [Microgenomates group bacterium]
MNIRPTKHDDLADLQEVLDGTELFPREMLPDMVSSFLSGDDGSDLWLTCEVDGKAVGFCYAVPEELTDRAWNMLALAVLPMLQGKGHGSALVARLEATLKGRSQRILIADTSGVAAFAQTREFYRKNHYIEEARIRDFWAAGDDKIVFWKSLA